MEQITFKNLRDIIMRRRIPIVCFSLIVGVAVFCVNYFFIPKRYRSEASMTFKSSASMLPEKFGGSINDFLGNMAAASTEINFDVVLKSRMLAERVFLNPSIRRRFNTIKQFNKMDDEELVASQMELIETKVKTKAILLKYEGPTPQLAADVLNLYFKELDKYMVESYREKRKFLERQLTRYEKKLMSTNQQIDIAVGPENKFKYEQLMRNKVLIDKSYAFVYAEYEKALMDENRKNEAFRVLDTGNVPRLKCYPKTVLTTLIFTFATACFFCYIFIFLELRKRGSASD